jgi:hypothetical protein
MINELAEDAQFIITTFRPELLVHADNHLGVIFDARKVSTIKQLTADEVRGMHSIAWTLAHAAYAGQTIRRCGRGSSNVMIDSSRLLCQVRARVRAATTACGSVLHCNV